jgi:hypothetical protein
MVNNSFALIDKLDIFPLMCAADKVLIIELTFRTCCYTSDNVCVDLQSCRYSISIILI